MFVVVVMGNPVMFPLDTTETSWPISATVSADAFDHTGPVKVAVTVCVNLAGVSTDRRAFVVTATTSKYLVPTAPPKGAEIVSDGLYASTEPTAFTVVLKGVS